MRIRSHWHALTARAAVLGRRLRPRARKAVAAGTAVVTTAALTVVAVTVATSHHTAPPTQPLWGSAAARPHRVSAAATMGRIVDGRVVPAPNQAAARAGKPVIGPVAKSPTRLVKGAVPGRTAPRPVRLPVQGTAQDKVKALRAPAPPAKTGYNPKTSRSVPTQASANRIVYANADGTKTAFVFQNPVNYRQADGRWTPINTTLEPSGNTVQSATTGPAPTPSLIQTTAPAGGPREGWRERSAAAPVSFAPFADAPDLVTVPVGSAGAVSFGIAGASHTAGSVHGSTVSYAGLAGGSDVSFTAGSGLVKEQIVLRSAAAPGTWMFPLHLTGLRAKLGRGGIVEFVNPKGRVVAYVPPGFMTDSNVDPHSGDGVTSYGVRYSLTTAGGRPAIKMTLNSAWLHAAARKFPVTVDPSVTTSVNSGGTTYVESPYNNDYSTDTEIKVGTWDGGTNQAKSFLNFASVASSLKNDYVLGVRLGVFNTWSYSCSPRTVYVYPVTSSWPVSGAKSWPGPSTGGEVGQLSFATGWVPLGSTVSPCPASWQDFRLTQAGTSLVNGWTHNTVTDNGLAMGASGSDSYAWKKFASDSAPNGDPFLAVTYTSDAASYKLASSTPITPVEPGQNGKFAIKVTNTGASTWTAGNGYEMSYVAYNSAGKQVASHPVFTPMPSTVAPGQTVTVNTTVDSLAAGSYAIDFQMYSGASGSNPVAFKTDGIQPLGVGLYVPQPPPVVTSVYPPTGYVSPTLTPQLSTVASTKSGTITYSFTVTCAPLPGQTCPGSSINSGTLTVPYWTIPAAEMQWNTPYTWTAKATVNGASTTVGPVSLTPEVPQPDITGSLGGSSGQAFDPQSGNFTTSATDASVASAGPPLQIQRSYNSLDPRASGAFGAGWSSVIDTAVRPDSDGSGNVVVTMPGGQEIRFGQNGNGTYAAPFGSSDALVHNSPGTWTLLDSGGDQYGFTSAGQIAQITDANGLGQTFTGNASGQIATITDTASGRTLQLTWSTPSGAAYPHVATVSTSPPASGQSGYTWSYSYTGDDLTQVCAATGGCTAYSYTTGSHYRSAVLDSGPRSYWQLGEASGATTATDEADANLGTTNGTYNNVTLGVTGPLAGSTETAAGFNGTNSSVALPAGLITDGTNITVELWFKAASSTASGVLFSYDADALSSSTGNTDHHDPALYVGGNGELYGELWNGSIDPIHTPASVDDGNWHYAVLTASSTSQSLYLDGALVGSVSGQINQQNMTVDTIGAGFWQGGWPNAYITVGPTTTDPAIGYFNGDIAQTAVYPHGLGGPAIASHRSLATTASAELTQVTMPSGNVHQQASYDPATGRLASYTDPNGGQWTIGNPVATGYKATSDSLGEVVRYVTVTDPAGQDEVYGYDALDGGRLVSYSNGIDPPQTFGYDSAGFVASSTDADGNLICFTNDIHGNPLTRTWYPVEPGSLPGGGTGTVSGCGGSTSSSPNCPSSGAPCTTFYSYYYDASNPVDPRNNELTGRRDGRSSSATSSTYLTSYAYNAGGQLTSSTTPATSDFPSGRTTGYTYSNGTQAAYGGGTIPAGLLLTQTTPGGAQTSYTYYSDGDLAKVTEPSGRYTVYGYDALGRALTGTVYTTSYPSGLATAYTYNAANQPVSVTSPGVPNPVTGVTHTLQDTYGYDADGNLVRQAQSDATGADTTRTTSYVYDDHDQVATVVQPAGATSGGGSQSQGASSPYPQGATTSYGYDSSGNVTSVTDENGNVDRYSYNEYNEVLGVTLYTSATSQANPVANCAAPATQDPDGGCDLVLGSYTYDPAGLLAASTDALNRTTNYTYDHDQDLIAATQTDASTSPSTGRQATCTYDGAGNLVSQAVSAMSGGAVGTSTVTNYTVDAAGRLASVLTDPTPSGGGSGYVNRTTAYTYNADNQVTAQTVSDSAGSSSTDYGYNPADELTSQTVPDGGTSQETTWTYDQNGLPLSMTSPRGNVSGGTPASYTTNYTYNQAGQLATVTGPPVATQTYQAQTPVTTRPVSSYGYDTFGDQTQVKNPDSNVTVTGYDGDGRVTSVIQPSYTPPGTSSPITATTQYAYDGDGNLVQVTDPAKNVTGYTYNALGEPVSQTDAQLPGQSAPGVWNFGYDAAGELLSVTDPLNNETQATYDYFGHRATATDARGHTTQYRHDYLGDVTQVTTPDAAVTKNTYDHLGELTSTADAYGDTTGYSYNHLGEIAQLNNPDGSFAQYGYDPAGQLTSVADYSAAPPGQGSTQLRSESFGYDPDGNLGSVKNWNGNTTSYAYNAAEQITSQVQPVTSSTNDTTSYGYDPAGNQTASTGGNGNTTWTTYNSWNRPESVVEPATPAAPSASQRTWTTGYNADGQAAAVTQPGGVTQTYGYDPLGDLTSQSGSGATAPTTSQSYVYNNDALMTSATAPGGTDSFTYNADNQLSGTTGPSGTSSFNYNNDGLMSSQASTSGTASYGYDNADRLSTVADPLTSATLTYGYNSDSLPSSVSYATGGTAGPKRSFLYNGLQQLTTDTLASAGGATIASGSYGYDNDGNLAAQATTGYAGAGSTSYKYNEADELTSATTGGSNVNYNYDSDGNLTTAGGTSYNYDAQDQVTSSVATAGTTNYAYTLSGSLASVTPPGGGAQSYTTNAYGQTATAPGGVSYGYDGLGRLATRTSGAGTAGFSYAGSGDTLASDGSISYSYDPAGDLVAVKPSGGSAAAATTNPHGNVTGTFSTAAGTSSLASSAAYSPYGAVTASTGTMPSLGYQGQYTDPGTGQVDMSARWYSPATGGFTSNDTWQGRPLPSTVDGNPYGYADGAPLTNEDPSGHLCTPCITQGLELGGEEAGAAGVETGPWDFVIAGAGAILGGALGYFFGSESSGSTGRSTGSASGDSEPRCVGLTLACDMPSYDYGWGAPDYGIASAVPIGYGYSGYGGYGYAGYGGYGYGYFPVAPPPPPPPPQDCYAGPHPTCSVTPASKALRTTPYITSPVHYYTSASALLRGPNKIIEKLPPQTTPVSGLKPSTTTNGNAPSGSGSNTSDLLTPLHNLQPATPTASVPTASVATPTATRWVQPQLPLPMPPQNQVQPQLPLGFPTPQTSTSGGSAGAGGGGPPPVSNGCDPEDGDQTPTPDMLGPVPAGKAGAMAGSTRTLSGWGQPVPPGFSRISPQDVLALQQEMGFPAVDSGVLDQGVLGQYLASHAERQLALLEPDKPIYVSRPMCEDCKAFFQRLAQFRGTSQSVTDPLETHNFDC